MKTATRKPLLRVVGRHGRTTPMPLRTVLVERRIVVDLFWTTAIVVGEGSSSGRKVSGCCEAPPVGVVCFIAGAAVVVIVMQ